MHLYFYLLVLISFKGQPQRANKARDKAALDANKILGPSKDASKPGGKGLNRSGGRACGQAGKSPLRRSGRARKRTDSEQPSEADVKYELVKVTEENYSEETSTFKPPEPKPDENKESEAENGNADTNAEEPARVDPTEEPNENAERSKEEKGRRVTIWSRGSSLVDGKICCLEK